MTELQKRTIPLLQGERATCLVLRCTHSRYENEMTPLPPSRLPTRARSSIGGQECGPAEKQKSSVSSYTCQ